MKKKLFILLMMALVYFAPAIIIKENYNSSDMAVAWLLLGWMPAIFVGTYLEE